MAFRAGRNAGSSEPMIVDLDTVIANSARELEYYPLREATSASFLEHRQRKEIGSCRCLRAMVVDPSRPSTSAWMDWWEMMFIWLTFLVSITAPYEIAFRLPERHWMYYIDRFGDVAFALNMLLQFITAYPDPKRPSRYVKDPLKIMKYYLKGWFALDVMTVLPVDLLFVVALPVRLQHWRQYVHLLRLVRMFRFQSSFRRFMHAFGFSFSMLTLVKFMVSLVFCVHWMACIWSGFAMQLKDTDTPTWLSALKEAKQGEHLLYEDSFEVYTLALYYSIVTLTSIGYGDATPQSLTEYMIACVSMSVMAGMWAYVIGSVCSIVSSFNPHEQAFQRTMDDLNMLMTDRKMPQELRSKLRRYFYESRDMAKASIEETVIDQLSPMLQGKCALFIHGESINKIAYFRNLPHEFVYLAARHLRIQVYAPDEEIVSDRVLNIIRRGLCGQGNKVKAVGYTWGEDMLLDNPALRDNSSAHALSCLTVLRLTFQDVIYITMFFPEARKLLRWEQIRMALHNGVTLLARHFRRWETTGRFRYSDLPEGVVRECLVREILSGNAPPDAQVTTAAITEMYSRRRKSSLGSMVELDLSPKASASGKASLRPAGRVSVAPEGAILDVLQEMHNSIQELQLRMASLERSRPPAGLQDRSHSMLSHTAMTSASRQGPFAGASLAPGFAAGVSGYALNLAPRMQDTLSRGFRPWD